VPDFLLAVCLALLMTVACFQTGRLLTPTLFTQSGIWFDSDNGRVYNNITVRTSDHYRTNVHPLFSLLLHPPVYAARHVLGRMLGLDTETVVRLVVAAGAGALIAIFFIFLRALRCRRLDAALFATLAACSASTLFWTAVPETYPAGSITLLAALLAVALFEGKRPSPWPFVLVSALSLSITITNWMAGIAATAVSFPWRRAIQITVSAFCLVTALWGFQKLLYPSAQFFLGSREEGRFMFRTEAGGPRAILTTFVVDSVVMPDVRVIEDNTVVDNGRRLSVQKSPVGSSSRWGFAAASVWIALLALGAWALFTLRDHARLRLALGLTLLGQISLHLIYGEETFLYSMHYMPLLVAIASLTTLTRARRLALALATCCVALTAVNNASEFERTRRMLGQFEIGRRVVLDEMRRRPADPWPRGSGHVVLAIPGSLERDKAYLEPGASFSPVPGSFGVSIWLLDEHGRVVVTSDTLPVSDIRQQFVAASQQTIPDLLTETRYYRARWSLKAPGRWQLDVAQLGSLRPIAVVRSVGPAGGRIDDIGWMNQTVRVNERWQLGMQPAPSAVYVGEEGRPHWMTEQSTGAAAHSNSGWGYARIYPSGEKWALTIIDNLRAAAPNRLRDERERGPVVELPDPRFRESLEAQQAHLLMGLVNDETRPGDPMSYPLPWLRDGAYAVVALARAGRIQTARTLAEYMASHDFYGGFGPEADAPGLALWAIEEVAARVRDPRFDSWLWPHVQRKAGWIEQLLSARAPLDRPVIGPIVPGIAGRSDLGRIADPAQNGLIVGRMDFERPLLFVNAVSYRGLLDAASVAERSGHHDDAMRWRGAAARLQRAWETAFVPPESDNDRTFVASLWPTGIGYDIESKIRRELEKRWDLARTADGDLREQPLWTYFTVAEAHQWLFIGDTDRVLPTLRWFWSHQASPGLYTWWEGLDNSFLDWNKIRGWVKPIYITPHYWTAAEMMLLQLDMLGYEPPVPEPSLVIGAGVPREWLKQPLRIQQLSLRSGRLNWTWDGHAVSIQTSWNIDVRRVRLGTAFPAETPIRIQRF
jgi:hypothetical protein